jgi:carboxypeptidase D
VIETFPQLIGYDTAVYQYFKTQHHLCGYDINLTYPQTGGNFPTLEVYFPESEETPMRGHWLAGQNVVTKSAFMSALKNQHAKLSAGLSKREEHETREARAVEWKRDLTGRLNGTIDTWYYCELFTELADYALNYTFPWSEFAHIVVHRIHPMLNEVWHRYSNCTLSRNARPL